MTATLGDLLYSDRKYERLASKVLGNRRSHLAATGSLMLKKKMVVRHFKESHTRDDTGKFIVPLPMKENADLL